MHHSSSPTRTVLGMPMISLIGLLLPIVAIGALAVVGALIVFGYAIPTIVALTLILVAAGITLASG